MFGLKRVDLNYGNGLVPKFNITNLNIESIRNGMRQQSQSQPQHLEVKKVLRTSNDLFASISRRYNKFRYAYYNKGVSRLDKEKIIKCYNKTRRFLVTLQHMHRKLLADNDPRAESFGKKVAIANNMVQKYGAYVMRLTQGKCARPKYKIKNRNKIRK
jgi:hypothetical protein